MDLMLLTDRSQLPAGRDLVEHLAACVDAGARTVVLRERDLPAAQRAGVAWALAALLHPVGGRLLVASPAPVGGGPVPYDALHHPAAALHAEGPSTARRDGWSTHDGHELRRAVARGAAHVTVSPFALSASKPGYGPALGAAGLRALLAGVDLGGTRVYALGGITPANAADALGAGAHGVAVMGEVMRAADPGAVVRALVGAGD